MAEFRFPTGIVDSRLVRVHLPRVQIEDKGLLLLHIDSLQSPSDKPIGEETKIPSPADGDVLAQDRQGGEGVLNQFVVRPFEAKSGSTGDAVLIVNHWENRRVPCKTEFLKNIERPKRPFGDGVRWRTIPMHTPPSDVFQDRFGLGGILTKCVGTQIVDLSVPITVTGNVMTACDNVANHGGVSFGCPANDEKGALDAMRIKHVKNGSGVALDPRGISIPLLVGHDSFEGRDLEIVLNVYGKIIDRILMCCQTTPSSRIETDTLPIPFSSAMDAVAATLLEMEHTSLISSPSPITGKSPRSPNHASSTCPAIRFRQKGKQSIGSAWREEPALGEEDARALGMLAQLSVSRTDYP